MKVLFIGGTGIISSACAQLAVRRNFEVTLLVRGQSDRPPPNGVRIIKADIRNPESVHAVLGSERFDAVADFVAFTVDHVETDLDLFRDRTEQLIFISSASAYQTPPRLLPVTESTPLSNPIWRYSRDKIACEERLIRAYREQAYPVTIVRPSHTYDERSLPLHGGWTNIERMRQGRPVVVHGDGSSLWVLTHHRDFASGFVGLLGNERAIGQAVHITSDEVLTWDEITRLLGRAARANPRIVHVPSDQISAVDRDWGDSLLGDKTHSMIFDNTKIKRLVPEYVATTAFARGAEEIIAWYDAHPEARVVDPEFDRQLDRLCARWQIA